MVKTLPAWLRAGAVSGAVPPSGRGGNKTPESLDFSNAFR